MTCTSVLRDIFSQRREKTPFSLPVPKLANNLLKKGGGEGIE